MADDTKNSINNKKFLVNPEGTTANFSQKRDVILWRTPGLGYIEMYINPNQIRITQRKISQTTRTKAGFIYQYAGEDLTSISIDGTTGSSGIEGINLLEKVYRAEQIKFEQIAGTTEAQQALGSGASGLGSIIGGFTGSSASSVLGSVVQQTSRMIGADPFEQPYPTLATLASAVEMHYQGVTYRGFFADFAFTESADSPGLFSYTIAFTSYAKSGERKNFMPWHRRPLGQSNSNSIDNFSIIDIFDPNAPDPEQQPDPEETPEQTQREDLIEQARINGARFAQDPRSRKFTGIVPFGVDLRNKS